MTDTGYKNIIEKLEKRVVTMPDDDYNLETLSAWLSGYAACQHDVLEIIEDMQKGSVQRD